MKKTLSIFILAFVVIVAAIPTNAGCPQGSGSCTGVCVAIYDANGKIGSYTCDTGATAAPKDCTQSAIEDVFSAP